MAPRRHLLLRLWVVATAGVVMAIAAGAYWWEGQLPGKLRQASRDGDLNACLRYSEQLAALRWLGKGAPEEQALCRREQAQRLWDRGERHAALALQQQLVQSGHGDASLDRKTLNRWRDDLRDQALELFRDGELESAIALLAPLDQGRPAGSGRLGEQLQEVWNRNRLENDRLEQLMADQRWWEALDSLNRLDHPWWQDQASGSRRTIESAINALRSTQEHQQHGASDPDVIAGAELDEAVRDRLVSGMDPWEAFQESCSNLGGAVEEDGPESFCLRRPAEGP